jgi:hypothetical protein
MLDAVGEIWMDVIDYMIVKALAGRKNVLEALVQYAYGRIKPSEAYRYGVSKLQLKGTINRIYTKAYSCTAALELVKRVAPMVIATIDPIIEVDGSYIPRCKICGMYMISRNQVPIFPEDHVVKRHRDIVKKHRDMVLSELKRAGLLKVSFRQQSSERVQVS